MLRTKLVQALLVGTGVAHLIPATAVRSRRRVESIYEIEVADPDAELLLRHRATFFGLIGAGLLDGALVPRHRAPAITAGIASLGTYIALAHSSESANPRLAQVKQLDIGLITALIAAAALSPGRKNYRLRRR